MVVVMALSVMSCSKSSEGLAVMIAGRIEALFSPAWLREWLGCWRYRCCGACGVS